MNNTVCKEDEVPVKLSDLEYVFDKIMLARGMFGVAENHILDGRLYNAHEKVRLIMEQK